MAHIKKFKKLLLKNVENAGNRKAMLQALKTLKSLRSLKMATRYFNGGEYFIRCAFFFFFFLCKASL